MRERSMADDSDRPTRRPPPWTHYMGLNVAVWVFLTFQAWILSLCLDSSRSIILISFLLGLCFFMVSLFDYVWLRLNRREDHS